MKIYLFWLNTFLFIYVVPALCGNSVSLDSTSADSAALLQTGQSLEMGGYFYKVFLVTAILLLALVGGFYLFKKFGGEKRLFNNSPIRVLARQNIGPKQAIVLVVIEDKKYALGVTDQAVNILADLGEADKDETADLPSEPLTRNFGALLARLRKDR